MAMAIILSDISAALFWESQSLEGPHAPRRVMSQPDCGAPTAHDVKAVRDLPLFASDECVHILVDSQNHRRVHSGIKCHSCSFDLPAGSFFKIGDGLLVTSPELTFVQMAQRLSFVHLVHFGMMLCGMYTREADSRLLLDGRDAAFLDSEHDSFGAIRSSSFKPKLCGFQRNVPESKRPLRVRAPLTSPEELKSYAGQVKGLTGASAASRAASYVVGRSRSPMESALMIALCLPYKFGGFKLPQPKLNYAVYVAAADSIAGGVRRDAYGKPYFECDLVWPDSGVIVEYHGDAGHFTREGTAKDARKSNILTREGYSLFTATLETFSSPLKFNEFAHGIYEKVGKRYQCRIPDFGKRGEKLREALRNDYLHRLRVEDALRCYKCAE